LNYRNLDEEMYQDFKLCDCLKPSEICLVVEQLTERGLVRKFHKHVPKSRVNQGADARVLHALFMRFSGADADTIVNSYLNKRKPVPERPHVVWAYPEPGVLRTYCGSMAVGDTIAWSDRVTSWDSFRQTD